MTRALLKSTLREIKNSKARFISIMAIIALGVGFFAGIKATTPSMYNLAETYYSEQNLMDYRLISTVGFEEDDIKAVSEVDGVTSVMPSYFCDAIKIADQGGDIVHLMALPTSYDNNELINMPNVMSGRLPEKSGEIVVEYGGMSAQHYELGDKVNFTDKIDNNDTIDSINKLEYTIVGVVESPLYISYQRGMTTVGSGKIGEFMYIMPDDFAIDRYTELFVKTKISDEYSAFSDEYTQNIEEMSTTLQNTADARCEVFDTDTIGKAKQELQDSKDKLSDEKAKAQTKLDEAKAKLEDANKEYDKKIADAQAQLDSAKAEIENGKKSLDSATNEYYSQIKLAEDTIASKEAELGAARKEYNSSKEKYTIEIQSAQQLINDNWKKYNQAYDDFKNNQEPQLVAGIAQAQSTVDQLTTAIASTTDPDVLASLKAQLAQAQQTLDNLNLQYSQATQALEQNKTQLEQSQKTLDTQKAEGQTELDSALAQLEDGESQLNSAKNELQKKKADGLSELELAQAKIDDAQSQYDSGVAELKTQKADGQKQLDDAQKEYDSQKADADEKFAEAQGKIDDAQEEIDNLTSPEWYVFNRDDNPGYSFYSQNANRLDAVATVFPLFFLLVAVLVCVTTMTRLIEEKRTEIGTLKALGYSNRSIVMKFVIYSMLAGILGCLIGTVLGVFTLPFIIFNAYKIMYYIGDITLVLNVPSIIIGTVAALLCTVCVSIIVCMGSLHHKPSWLMRPKAPKPGKRILFERITPLWKRLGFSAKLTIRNLFRYKSRLCMTVIGVAGCTALIVAAFGLLNCFDPLTHDQFETIYEYNAVIVPKDSGTQQDLKYLTDKIDNNENVECSMLMKQEEATLTFNNQVKDADTNLVVVQDPQNMDSIISVHTRVEKQKLTLDNSGVMINEKLATEFGIKVGDTVSVQTDHGTAQVKVSGIFEQYLHNYIYITPDLYKQYFDDEITYNSLNVKLVDTSEEAEDLFASTYLADSKIAAVSFIDASIDEFKNMLNSLNLVVLVMIICAAALAFVVLYNLTNINIAERIREIATFKVLGFYNKETSSFIYRENIVLTILGIALGLVLGIFLTSFIVQTVEVDNIMFGRTIYFTSFVYAAGLTMLFSLLVNAVMSFKIKAINMVESLKSIE